MPEWTEGVCGDGVAILKDGQPVPVSTLLELLSRTDARLHQWRADYDKHKRDDDELWAVVPVQQLNELLHHWRER